MKMTQLKEDVTRNKSIISRNYAGETLKSIAQSIGLSYGRTCELAQRDRKRILARFRAGEEVDLIISDYNIDYKSALKIIDIETIREDEYKAREHAWKAEQAIAWDRYVEGMSNDIYECFKNGERVDDIASDNALSRDDVLRFLEDELAKRIRSSK